MEYFGVFFFLRFVVTNVISREMKPEWHGMETMWKLQLSYEFSVCLFIKPNIHICGSLFVCFLWLALSLRMRPVDFEGICTQCHQRPPTMWFFFTLSLFLRKSNVNLIASVALSSTETKKCGVCKLNDLKWNQQHVFDIWHNRFFFQLTHSLVHSHFLVISLNIPDAQLLPFVRRNRHGKQPKISIRNLIEPLTKSMQKFSSEFLLCVAHTHTNAIW